MAKTPTNDPARKGQIAGSKRCFGEFSRFAVYPVHTRFDAVAWMVADADLTDPVTGLPEVIRIADTEAEAVTGLEGAA